LAKWIELHFPAKQKKNRIMLNVNEFDSNYNNEFRPNEIELYQLESRI